MYSTGVFTTNLAVKKLKTNQVLWLIPFGDMHCDSPLFSEHKWEKFIKRIEDLRADPKNVVVTIGMGDYIDYNRGTSRKLMSTLDSGEHNTLQEALEMEMDRRNQACIERLEPLRGTIIGFLEGNHYGLYGGFVDPSTAGKTTTDVMAEAFGVPSLGVMNITLLRFGRRADEKRKQGGAGSSSIKLCLHHGKGGGQTAGATLNRIEKMSQFVNADITLMGHDHQCAVRPIERLDLCPRSLDVVEQTRWIGRTGSFLKGMQSRRSSYVADAGLGPNYLGWIEFQIKVSRTNKADIVDIIGGYGAH